ncbi:inosine/xanthosine triphosphatase [Chitinophagales bacterium]|nr:inosine/xanthosine triphosphatase [Chitinophagales bacterium]
MKSKIIYVASKNPVKIEATKSAFEKVFPKEDFQCIGVSINSEVSDQPSSSEETYKGALNRAQGAKNKYPDGNFWVGIEGGIEFINSDMHIFAWMMIIGKDRKGYARTASFVAPPKVAELVQTGMELGDADDIVFKKENSKQKTGAAGLLTGNIIHRRTLYEPALILALVPFINRGLFPVMD